MLQIGLTGGIGAGKSTASRRLVELGAVLSDADLVAREVVAAGTPGLAQIVEAFGPEVLLPDGEMDRAKVASIVFGDEERLAVLNGITHPLIGRRQREIIESAGPEQIVVNDAALIVEWGRQTGFPLLAVVHTDAEVRVRRLVDSRGMDEADARARIARQISDAARLAAADAVLPNDGTEDALRAHVDRLWHERLVPMEENVRLRRPARGGAPVLVEAQPGWAERGDRIVGRVAAAAGPIAVAVAHIGSTAVPGLAAKDVTDVQLVVGRLEELDDRLDALAAAGFLEVPEIDRDRPRPADPDPARWRKRYLGGADPGQRVHLHVREAGSPGARYAVLFRDWLRADAAARDEYLQVKRAAAAEFGGDPNAERYVERKEPWFDAAAGRAEAWALSTGWTQGQ